MNGITSFHSLRTGKHIQSIEGMAYQNAGTMEFPFPPNGKAYPKNQAHRGKGRRTEFPFPPNGKAYPKVTVFAPINADAQVFPFPPNGKAYPKRCESRQWRQFRRLVSIPSERESISKAIKSTHRVSYNQPFPFPPNGKAYPKSDSLRAGFSAVFGFHSLRTGKHIQRPQPLP